MAIEEFIIEDEPFNVEKHTIPQNSWWEKLFLPFERAWYWLVDKWNRFRYRYQCFDKVIDWILPQCKHNPMTEYH